MSLRMDVDAGKLEAVLRAEITSGLETLSAREISKWALDQFLPSLARACSFQAEGFVLIGRNPRTKSADYTSIARGRAKTRARLVVSFFIR